MEELKKLLDDPIRGLKESSNTNKTYNSILALFEEVKKETKEKEWGRHINFLLREKELAEKDGNVFFEQEMVEQLNISTNWFKKFYGKEKLDKLMK